MPPPLFRGVTPIESFLSPSELAEASEAWLQWWRRFIHTQGAIELGEFTMSPNRDDGRARRTAAFRGEFDPPDFECLTASHPLQEAARRTCGQALHWWRDYRDSTSQDSSGSFETPKVISEGAGGLDTSNLKNAHANRMSTWTSRKLVAEAIIEEYQVSPSRVNAGVVVLEVSGRWSRIQEPGLLLCSGETFADNDQFLLELKKAFETGLRRST